MLDEDGDEIADGVALELEVLLTHDGRDMVAGHARESCRESIDDLVDRACFLVGVHASSVRPGPPSGQVTRR